MARLERGGENPLRAAYDVFVSYAHADKREALRIRGALERHGLRVWFDESLIASFEGISASVERGLAASKALLAVYSTSYSSRRACQWELTTAFLAAQRHGEDPRSRVLVVCPERSATNAPLSDHIDPVELRDALFAVAPGRDDDGILDQLAVAVADRVMALPGSIGELHVRLAPAWHGRRPVAATRFVGRVADMWKVHSALQAGEVGLITGARGATLAQVTGMGGIGKSLLAEEYAMRFGAAYPGGVFWLRAHGNDDGRPVLSDDALLAERDEQLRTFAVELGCEADELTPEQVRAALSRVLEERAQPYLWVVDDLADGLERWQRDDWLACGRFGKTLITTRSRAYGAVGTQIELGTLSADEGLELLRSHRSINDSGEEDAARTIVAELGGHALALDVAGAALRAERGVRSVAEYLAAIGSPMHDELELAADLSAELPSGHQPSIARTLAGSLEALSEEAMDLLRLATVLAVQPVPPSLVAEVFARVDGLDRPVARERAVRALRGVDALSLVDLDEDGSPQVHAVVSRMVRYRERSGGRRAVLRQASIAAITADLEAANARSIAPEGHVVVHARHLAAGAHDEHEAKLLNAIGMHTYMRGDYRSALAALEQATQTLRRVLGSDHLETLAVENNLAAVRHRLGDLRTATIRHSEVLKAIRRRLGDDHPQTLSAMSRLATALLWQGKDHGAERLAAFVLEARTAALGADHPDTLAAMDDLAVAQAHGYFKQDALGLFEQVLTARRRVLGADHPDTLTTMSSLGRVLLGENDIAGARRLLEPAAATLRRVLGDEHPATLRALSDLAATFAVGGEPAAARVLNEEVLAGRERVLGAQHTDTLASVNQLAATLEAQDDPLAAMALYEHVLRMPPPPETLHFMTHVETPQEVAEAALARIRGDPP